MNENPNLSSIKRSINFNDINRPHQISTKYTSILPNNNIHIITEFIIFGYIKDERMESLFIPNGIIIIICKYFGSLSLSNIISDMTTWDSFIHQISSQLNASNIKLTKLYEAKVDGFNTEIFHKKCDNKGATLCIIKNTNNYIFGGYTSQSWETPPNMGWKYCADSAAFIYGIKPKLFISEILKDQTPFALFLDASYSIDFGNYGDIVLSHNKINPRKGFSRRYSYNCTSNIKLVSDEQKLDEIIEFDIVNYEVFSVD